MTEPLKYVVGYDGSAASKRAIDFAAEIAGRSGAVLVIAYVLDWSPYSFLTPEELESRHRRRTQELERAAETVKPIEDRLAATGLNVSTIIKYGHVADTLSAICTAEKATQVFIGRMGENSLSARLFGSVAGSLAQVAPVPCTIVP